MKVDSAKVSVEHWVDSPRVPPSHLLTPPPPVMSGRSPTGGGGGHEVTLALTRGGGGWHKASVLGCLPLAVSIGLSPLLVLTLRGSERVLVVSTEPPDDLSCWTTPVPETGCCPCH